MSYSIRPNVSRLPSSDGFGPVMLAYAGAYRAMSELDPAEPTSIGHQAQTYLSDGQRGSWFFLPWNRMFLYFFERIVRRYVVEAGGPADFNLPYWQPAADDEYSTMVPLCFQASLLPDGSSNPLWWGPPFRSETLMTGGFVSFAALHDGNALTVPDFSRPWGPCLGGAPGGPTAFAATPGLLEGAPHDSILQQVGGRPDPVGAAALLNHPTTAPTDPLLFLHLANIDRLWSEWLRDPAHQVPAEQAWWDQTFSFADETGTLQDIAVSDVVDPGNQLGYAYDTSPDFQFPGGEIPLTTQPEPVELAATLEPLWVPAGGGTRATLAMTQDWIDWTWSQVDGGARVSVRMEDVQAVASTGVVHALSIEHPTPQDPNAYTTVGVIGLYGIDLLADPGGATGTRQSFDVTDVLRLTPGVDLTNLTVVIDPHSPYPAEAGGAEAVESETTDVTIGRVVLELIEPSV